MQKVFNLTNKYIVLATPLILYSLISSIYLAISLAGGKVINLILAIVLFTLMTAAFIAGWFNMVKIAILEPDREDPNSLIKEFVGGVGEYFVSSLGMIFVMFIVSTLALVGSYFIGMNTIGDVGISADALSGAMAGSGALKAFLMSLSFEQLKKLNCWNMLILGTITLTYFIFILYLPAMFFKNKNPFMAFFISLKDLFSKKLPQTIGIFLLIFVANFFISILATVLGGNVILHFIITLMNFYFVTLVGVGIFYYYHNSFVASKIGQNVDIEV